MLTQSTNRDHTTQPEVARQEDRVTNYQLPGVATNDTDASESPSSIADINSPEFAELLAAFIQATNSTINDLLERVAALEAAHHTSDRQES